MQDNHKKVIDMLCEALKDFDLDEDQFEWIEAKQTFTFELYTADEKFSFSEEKFGELPDEIRALQIAEDGSAVRTKNATYRIVTPVSTSARVLQERPRNDLPKLAAQAANGIHIGLKRGGFWVTFAALQRGAFDSDFLPADSYMSVEVQYSSSPAHRSDEEEERIVDAYLFELASSLDLAFRKDTLMMGDFPWDHYKRGQTIVWFVFWLTKFAEQLRLAACRAN